MSLFDVNGIRSIQYWSADVRYESAYSRVVVMARLEEERHGWLAIAVYTLDEVSDEVNDEVNETV